MSNQRGPRGSINVTPLVDVVLVLLIIFMVTMPISMRHLAVVVPPPLPDNGFPVKLTLEVTGHADGTVTLDNGSGKKRISRVEVPLALRSELEKAADERTVFVDFEDDLPWREAVALTDVIAGIGKAIPSVTVTTAVRTVARAGQAVPSSSSGP